MYRFISSQFLSIFFLILPFSLKSQIIPKEGKELNYRIISFSSGAEPSVGCTLEIAGGTYFSEDSFRKNIIKTLAFKSNRVIAEVPSFGSQYTWRVVHSSHKPNTGGSAFHHFTTGAIPEADTNITRFRVTKQAVKFNDAVVFLDGNKVMYDMQGHPAWYLPLIEGQSLSPTDLKLSPQGTITFLSNNQAYEINYNGTVLWKGPNTGAVSGDKEEHYHHDFTRLSNGHYMVLGLEIVSCNFSNDSSSFAGNKAMGEGHKDRLRFGTIIEYDEKGAVVWSWKSSKYFMASDVMNKAVTNITRFDVHENSFYFDEKDKIIYVSFKGISRVIKLKYPEGTIINSYGETYAKGTPEKGNGLFCGQHNVNHSQQGGIFLFDNNGCGNGAPPRIEIMKEPLTEADQLKITWEYQCTVECDSPKKFESGGSVSELPDHSMFVCMGGEYSKVFIVSYDKKILWSALPEKNQGNNQWGNIAQYRASIITDRKDLERLVRGTELKDTTGNQAGK